MSTVVLIHGAWHGSWCWDALRSELSDLDLRTIALPSVGGEKPTTLMNDAGVVRAAVEAVEGPVTVIAHSYGGAVASQALSGVSNVRHIGYVAAFALAKGESVLGMNDGEAPPWCTLTDDGWIQVNDPNVLYNDLEPNAVQSYASKLRPQSASCFIETLDSAAWESIPSTYVVCTQDQAIPVAAQRMMATRCGGAVRELESSHSPFLSQPRAVADLVREMVGQQVMTR